MAISITMPSDRVSFNRAEFERRVEDLLMRPGGVYAFYDDIGACLYVGQSKNLVSRLRSHFAASPFSAEISRIDIYFVDNPYDREIYETYAISALGGRYNKAKTYAVTEVNPLIRGEMDDILCEIDFLDAERLALEEDLRQIKSILHPPAPRKFNNVTGDISERYAEWVETHFREIDDDSYAPEEEQYRRIRVRLMEIDEEKEQLREKYAHFRSKLSL